jgi:hypothetical protein
MFCRGEYPRPRQVFDDAIITKDRDRRYHDNQQPLPEAPSARGMPDSSTVISMPLL